MYGFVLNDLYLSSVSSVIVLKSHLLFSTTRRYDIYINVMSVVVKVFLSGPRALINYYILFVGLAGRPAFLVTISGDSIETGR
jgi:hypothetical protein